MGKEQELIDAGRNGNVLTIDRLLGQKTRRSGPLAHLASFRRGPSPNCQDASGDTPLHYAALNGHRDAVELLLKYEASANILDCKVCTPLHLAAWSGNADICRLLLQQGPSLARIHERNIDEETALHCAAQYGHTQVVQVLLENGGDATHRNKCEETPLDLAAQYGKVETVQLLVQKCPSLLINDITQHSPLHLAAANGHRQVVQALIEAGFNVNTKTTKGSALHEAALYGKQDVVKFLLDSGIDTSIETYRGKSVLRALEEQTSQVASKIHRFIKDYLDERDSVSDAYTVPLRMPKGDDTSNTSQESPEQECIYDDLPPPRPKPTPRLSKALSPPSSPTKSLSGREKGAEEEQEKQDKASPMEAPSFQYEDCIYDVPQSVIKDSLSTSSSGDSLNQKPLSSIGYINIDNQPRAKEAPAKPPRKKAVSESSKATDINMLLSNQSQGSTESAAPCSQDAELQNTLDNETKSRTDSNSTCTNANVLPAQKTTAQTETLDNKKEEKVVPYPIDNVASNLEKVNNNEVKVPNKERKEDPSQPVVVLRRNRARQAASMQVRPPSLEFDRKRTSRGDVPLSPTHYQQPPTPDFPPPSPHTAVLGIQLQINPWEKRKSRDIETITEIQFLGPPPAASPEITQNVEKDVVHICVDAETETDDVPEKDADLGGGGVGRGSGGDVRAPLASTDSLEEEDCEVCAKAKEAAKDASEKEVSETVNTDDGESSNNQFQSSPPDATTECPAISVEGSTCQDASSPAAVEEIKVNDRNPFLGLIKGSTPAGQRRVRSQIYENIVAQRQKRRSAPVGTYPHFPIVPEQQEEAASDVVAMENKGKGKLDVGNHGNKDEVSPLDEKEEWAKVADILQSFGGRMSVPDFGDYKYFEAQLTELFNGQGSSKIQSVGDWLEGLELPQYENILVANGFDDMDFVAPNVLEEQDLLEIGILDELHRKKILEAVKEISPVKPLGDGNSPNSVEEWLVSLRLSEYLDTFHNHQYTTMNRVSKIWELELTTVLDISPLGHRRRILASLGDRQGHQRVTAPVDVEELESWSRSPGLESVTSEKQNEEIDFYKDYTSTMKARLKAEKKKKKLEESVVVDITQYESLERLDQENGVDDDSKYVNCDKINIRPPHHAQTESPIKQWRHRPEILIKGCCNYTAQYLGSTLVRELNGVESTKESITKLKQKHWKRIQRSTESIAKVPTIILSVSYKGVKFIDAKSKNVICEHEISNIFCACQDGDHLNFFAYITQDIVAEKHYCHVFCVRTMDLATEIILTLGEAFEVAYQVALLEKAGEMAELEKSCGPDDARDSTDARESPAEGGSSTEDEGACSLPRPTKLQPETVIKTKSEIATG